MSTKDIAEWETINLADRYASIIEAYDALTTLTEEISQRENDINISELQERITMPLHDYKVLLSELTESIRGEVA